MSWTTRLAGHQSVGEPRSSDPLISPNIASRMQNTFQILGYRLDDLALATLPSSGAQARAYLKDTVLRYRATKYSFVQTLLVLVLPILFAMSMISGNTAMNSTRREPCA